MDIKNLEKIESQTFRKLISHLQNRTDVQNIDIMNVTIPDRIKIPPSSHALRVGGIEIITLAKPPNAANPMTPKFTIPALPH